MNRQTVRLGTHVVRLPRTESVVAALAVLVAVILWPQTGATQVYPDPDQPLQFLVNTTTTGGQYYPSAAITNTDGAFVVVWDDVTTIYLQRFDADGNPVGSETLVSTTPTNNHRYPVVSADLRGNFVVVWSQQNGTEGIYARIWDSTYEPPGHPPGDPPGGFPDDPILVSAQPWVVWSYPAVAQDPNSDFVVAWDREPFGAEQGIRISARRFGGDGVPLGDRFDVSSECESDFDSNPCHHESASVAKDLSGGFVVTWSCDGCEDTSNEDNGLGARARRYNANGEPLGDEIAVNTYREGAQSRPRVAVKPSGGFVITWFGPRYDLGHSDATIFGKIFNEGGAALGDDILMAPYPDGYDRRNPEIAATDPDGHFMTIWTQVGQVFGRWFDATGQAWESPFELPSDATGSQWQLAIASDLEGDYVTLWTGEGPGDNVGIHGRLFLRPVLLSISDFSVYEGDGINPLESTAVFTVQASKEYPWGDVTVDWATADDTATFFDDYQIDSGSLVFSGGDLIETIQVEIFGDEDYEPDETFFVNLDHVTNAAISKAQGVGTILNDDDPPTVSIVDPGIINEDAGVVLFTVTLSPTQDQDAAIDFATSDGTATAGNDYEETSGNLVIPGGHTEGHIAVEIFDDNSSEELESFFVDLSNPVNAVLVDSQAEAFILDNDCYMLSDSTATFLPEGGTGTVWLTVAADPTCVPWSAISNDLWITDINPPGGSAFPDNVEISYTVLENTAENPRTGTMTIAGLTFTVEQEGTACSYSITTTGASFESWGGSGTVEVSADPESCVWEAVSNDPWITGLTLDPANGEGSGTLDYTVEVNSGVSRTGTITIALRTFTIDQDGIFFDDFDDDVMAPDWDYQSIELWEEANDSLRARAWGPGQTATARATWAFSGCIEGTITTRMRVNMFTYGTAKLYGWHRDDDNFVALTMDEFANQWTLTQRVDGVDVQSETGDFFTIEVGEVYDVAISFDGASFTVLVDDVQIINMLKAEGLEPDGTVAFSVSETDADFDEISASTVTRSGIFWDGFDDGDTTAWSLTNP